MSNIQVVKDRIRLDSRVFIEGNCFRGSIIELLASAGCFEARHPKEADFILFSGGEDIDPACYGQGEHPTTSFSTQRMKMCEELWDFAIDTGTPVVGICRGAQFLHAMNGGQLFQDVDNHTREHLIEDVITGESLYSTSIHHQMCKLNDNMTLVAKSTGVSTTREYCDPNGKIIREMGSCVEVEAFYYEKTQTFATQGHPELAVGQRYGDWFLEKVYEYTFKRGILGIAA